MNEFPKLDECLLSWLGAGRWRVLGRALRPLSLAHLELLRVAGSGVVSGGRMLLPDLDLAVQIGSRSPQAAARWLARPKSRLMGRLRTFWLLALYGWRMEAQWAELRHWLDSCVNMPEMLDKERQSDGIPFQRDAPPFLEVWTKLAGAGFPALAVAQEWPAGLSQWLYETLNTQAGNRKFETERDRELFERARQMRAITEPDLPPLSEVVDKAQRLMRAMRGDGLMKGD